MHSQDVLISKLQEVLNFGFISKFCRLRGSMPSTPILGHLDVIFEGFGSESLIPGVKKKIAAACSEQAVNKQSKSQKRLTISK